MNSIFKNAGLATPKLSDDFLYFLCAVITVAIFITDLNLPLGVAGGVPYITVILITLWSQKRNIVIHFAVACSVMTLLGYYFSPSGSELWIVLFNRALALLVIWAAAILVLKWKAYEEEHHDFRLRMSIATENKKNIPRNHLRCPAYIK